MHRQNLNENNKNLRILYNLKWKNIFNESKNWTQTIEIFLVRFNLIKDNDKDKDTIYLKIILALIIKVSFQSFKINSLIVL